MGGAGCAGPAGTGFEARAGGASRPLRWSVQPAVSRAQSGPAVLTEPPRAEDRPRSVSAPRGGQPRDQAKLSAGGCRLPARDRTRSARGLRGVLWEPRPRMRCPRPRPRDPGSPSRLRGAEAGAGCMAVSRERARGDWPPGGFRSASDAEAPAGAGVPGASCGTCVEGCGHPPSPRESGRPGDICEVGCSPGEALRSPFCVDRPAEGQTEGSVPPASGRAGGNLGLVLRHHL